MRPSANTPRVLIRVVKPPTTGEQLDQFYRERRMVHGGNIDHDRTMPQGNGCRRISAKGRT